MINLDVVSYKNRLVSNYIWKNHINYLNHNLELVDHVVSYQKFDFDVGVYQSLKLE
jgi:hypothetical protein